MRTPMPQSLLLMIGLTAALSSPQTLPAQEFILPYLGGGLRIGYVSKEGLSLGADVTLGALATSFVGLGSSNRGLFASVALGILMMPTAPKIIRYVSFGGGGIMLPVAVGASFGRTFYSLDGMKYTGTRSSLWGGVPFVLVSVDSYRFLSENAQIKDVGLWVRGALPMFIPVAP